MKKNKLLLIISIFAFNLNAQFKTDLSFETGASIAIFDLSGSKSFQFNKPVLNYNIGIIPSYTFIKYISFSSGLRILKTGFRKYEIDSTLPSLSNFAVNYYYFDIPLVLSLKPFKNIYFFGGFSFKYLFITNYNSKSIGKYIGSDFSAQKYIYNILFGVEYNIFKKIKVGAKVFFDKMPLQKDEYYTYRLYNQGFLFSCNYNIF